MRALQLDYQRSTRPVPWLGLGVLATALAAFALLASHYYELDQRIDQWEDRVAQDVRQAGHRARALQPVSAQAARDQALEVEHANQVLRQLSLPWDTLFRAVESAGGENVALLSMEPDIQKGSVRISGEAKNFDAMLEYIRQLATRDVFGSVHLQNHQIRQDDPQKPVRFSLLAVWKVEAP